MQRIQYGSLREEEWLLEAMRQNCRIVAVHFGLGEVELWKPLQSVRTSRPGSSARIIRQPWQIVVQDEEQIEQLKKWVDKVKELPRFWLEIMYPLSMAVAYGGYFPLHKAYTLSCERFAILFSSGDESRLGLEPGKPMQSVKYFFHKQSDAETSFDHAQDFLSRWPDSNRGEQYLLKLCTDQKKPHLGRIGETAPPRVASLAMSQ
jgi:hypothetical protein